MAGFWGTLALPDTTELGELAISYNTDQKGVASNLILGHDMDSQKYKIRFYWLTVHFMALDQQLRISN